MTIWTLKHSIDRYFLSRNIICKEVTTLVAHDKSHLKAIKLMKNRPVLFIILSWSWLLTIYDYGTSPVYGQQLTDRDNDPNDNTVDSIDGPLKIQLALEHESESPQIYAVKYYAFEFNGLKQQPKNYAIPLGHFIDVMIDTGRLTFMGIGPLEIENTTGTITEKDIHEMTGGMSIVKTIEDSTMGEITLFPPCPSFFLHSS